jgi:hypothetical protein
MPEETMQMIIGPAATAGSFNDAPGNTNNSLENIASGPRGARASEVSNLGSSPKVPIEGDWKGALDRSQSAGRTTPRTPPEPPETPRRDHKWTPTSEAGIKSLIANALNRYHGNVSEAFAYLRDLRQEPANYYNSNMAIAADYLRARWETQRCGPEIAMSEVEIYMSLKKQGLAPREGTGPVSPYSPLELQFMKEGVADQTRQMPVWEQAWWASPPGLEYGAARATWGVLSNKDGRPGER